VIPRRIRLRNFLSYRDCTVDFTGLHLAVLCGQNGHGKSALLDGMTWALWGKARGSRDADRIRGDATAKEMLVDFEFENGGAVYRVVRKFVPNKGSSLDFQQILQDGSVVPLGGHTLSATQQEIIRRLHLDYDTFVNSAFIAQGRSNEFTAKTPAERKQVLRNILGLDAYELLAQRAAELRNEVRQQLQVVEEDVARLTEAANEAGGVVERLQELEARRRDLDAALQAIEAELQSLQQAEARRQELALRVEELERRCAQLVKELEGNRDAETRAREELRGCEAKLVRQAEAEARAAELQRLREEEAALADLQRSYLRLAEQRRELEHRLALEQQRIEAALEQQRQALADCRAYADRGDAALRELGELERRLQERAAKAEAIAGQRQRAEELRRQAEGKLGEARTLHAQAEELKQQEEQLRAAAGAPECPVCHQPLTPEHVERVLRESAERRRAMGERFRALRAEAEVLAKEAAALVDAAEQAQREVDAEARADEERRIALEAARHAADEARAQIPALEEGIRALEEQLARASFGLEIREQLREVIDALAAVAYDPARHAELRAAIDQLRDADRELQEVRLAAERADWLRRELQRLHAEQGDLEEERAETERRLAETRRALEASEDVRPRLHEAEARRASLQAEFQETLTRYGALEERRRALEAMAAEAAQLRDKAAALREQVDVYGELAKAFGRDGVQAMLIDEAIPRLREMANALLDRMTGGRIHVDIRTQRELVTKKGAQQETLEIRVSDELGERSYEMYSGGEAFRVDFALRIALARLLAERAGATLATLIVDEGFGTQDRDGIDRLVEVLNAIAPEFELILVVTHLDELKERFERRIEVVKESERGSIVRVV